jgi:hypothetical protein
MSSTLFDRLAAGFCACAGVPAPKPLPHDGGVRSLATELGGVPLAVVHDPVQYPDHVFVLFTMGDVPAQDELACLRELMQANLLMLAPFAPSFSRHPESGELMMHYVLRLDDADGETLYRGCTIAVEAVRHWRSHGSFAMPASARSWPAAAAFV